MYKNSIRNNLAVVAAAVATALLAWAVVRLVGVELTVGKGENPGSVGPLDAALAALSGGGAACAVHALLVRRGFRAWWPFIGSAALGVSMTGPAYLADGGSAVALMCMHLLVGSVLIAGLSALGPASDRCLPRARGDHGLPQGY